MISDCVQWPSIMRCGVSKAISALTPVSGTVPKEPSSKRNAQYPLQRSCVHNWLKCM